MIGSVTGQGSFLATLMGVRAGAGGGSKFGFVAFTHWSNGMLMNFKWTVNIYVPQVYRVGEGGGE